MEPWNVHRMGEKTRSNKVKFLASYFELYIVIQSSGKEFPSIKIFPGVLQVTRWIVPLSPILRYY